MRIALLESTEAHDWRAIPNRQCGVYYLDISGQQTVRRAGSSARGIRGMYSA